MGLFNSWSGELRLRRGAEAAAATSALEDLLPGGVELHIEPEADADVDLLTIDGGSYMPAGLVNDIDKAITALSPYVVEAGEVLSEADGDRSRLYVGPPEGKAARASAGVLEDVRAAGLAELLPMDALALIEELLPKLGREDIRGLRSKLFAN